MKIFRDGRVMELGALLQRVLDSAEDRHPGRTALYLVGLADARGLALACAVHRLSPRGPGPLELHRRAQEMGMGDALVAGAVRIDRMEHALESLEAVEPPDRRLLVWTMRELHRHDGIPVVMLVDGLALIATLEALNGTADDIDVWGSGWPRPVGEA